ncbi:preprotein translocase subunit SecA [Candidatus Dependentiae bacterium]|nr:preprotein translocase subunit SecA [Candidatus Dependentiae bacterium]
MAGLLAKLLGTNSARQIKKLQPLVDRINYFEPKMQQLTDEQLTQKSNDFRQEIAQGRSIEDLLPEAFALVRETSKRKLGQRHFDVQLVGGIVLHQGKIAEMKTGEGKTLTATLPLYLNALEGKGAHLVTVNDYLARRDAEWMSPIYTHLGMSVGIIQNSYNDHERKKAYQSDIVYATNNELGFDYLRDNMKFRLEDYVQRDLNFAIVDEVDSILIDEARTPLIISGTSDESSRLYIEANRVVSHLKKDTDYEVDEKTRTSQLTEVGNDKVEAAFGVENIYALEHIKLLHHVNQALKAHALFKRDVEYVVKDGQVLIVDEFTGRILPGRRYSDGLHQAIEAKEKVTIERESQTLASITLQNFFRLYKKLAGMTGTAATEAEEFFKIYKLDVLQVPTNMPMIRIDKPDLIFLTKNAKYKAILADIKERFTKGQPVLIGTISIETSELLSSLLDSQNIQHEVLNAKNHAREAEIVAHAGEKNRITIATNMAGRGTDIKLTPESRDLGGLYILGTERHESRRIDNQLRGRSGRQGDPGESRFYISLDDDLIRIFAGDSIKKYMQRVGMTEDETIETSLIEYSQEKVEKQNFETRRYLLEYDDVLNQQRNVIYKYRREILEGEEKIFELIRDIIVGAVEDLVFFHNPKRNVTQESLNEILDIVSKIVNIPAKEIYEQPFAKATTIEVLQEQLSNYLLMKYDIATKDVSKQNILKEAHKWLLLETMDNAWKQHMLNLDHLKEGINLRSWGNKNPLIEYKREAFSMFEDMMKGVRMEVVQHIFHLRLEHFNQAEFEERREREMDELNMIGTALPGQEPEPIAQASSEKVGRNVECPCGSGKKFKKCHGKKA